MEIERVHIPVMLNKVIELLNIKPNGFYIDCTLGDGGHSKAIYDKLGDKGLLLSIDYDKNSINFVKKYYKESQNKNWIIINNNFINIKAILDTLKKQKTIQSNLQPDGILMDIGLSSRHIEKSKRGFSYREPEQPLDMRMDEKLQITASDLLNGLTVQELIKLFEKYGEERYAKRIAKTVKENLPIKTVGELNKVIYKALPTTNVLRQNKNPARRVFQALRIAVNDELNNLLKGLTESWDILDINGKLIVISFHSLEDRIVKNFFRKQTIGLKQKNKLIRATSTEIKRNPRASSAKLRYLEKT